MTICAAVLSFGSVCAQNYEDYSEAEAGDWAIGAGLNLASGKSITNFGFQLPRLQYYFHSNIRVEASFNYFFKSKECIDWDIDLDVHPYIFPMKYGLHVYPVVGLAFWHRKQTEIEKNWGRVGVNIGAGFQYDITERLFCNLQYKYFITNDFSHSNFNVGIAYRL